MRAPESTRITRLRGMPPAPIKVLLVEDEAGFAEVVSAELMQNLGPQAVVDRSTTLAAALGAVESTSYDAILLDLGLPDADGTSSLEELLEIAPDTPIVVLTARDQPDLPLKAIRAGAQDFLTKTGADSTTVSRSLTYAIERHRLVAELNADLERVQRVAAGTESQGSDEPLAEQDDDSFLELVRGYVGAVEVAIAPGSRQSRDPIAKRLRKLALDIGSRGGTPRDVVDIHVAAIGSRDLSNYDPVTVGSEAQLLLVELMGHLAAFYRQGAISQ